MNDLGRAGAAAGRMKIVVKNITDERLDCAANQFQLIRSVLTKTAINIARVAAGLEPIVGDEDVKGKAVKTSLLFNSACLALPNLCWFQGL